MITVTIFPGVYSISRKESTLIATLNLTPGRQVYGEQLISEDNLEYRSWTPYRSKLSAAIRKGLKSLPLKKGDLVLYLGVASGTTCSHLSDIIGIDGHIWGLDFATRSLRDFINNVARYRKNLSPILGDARKPETYASIIPNVDVLYVDVAQPDQAELTLKNASYFLKQRGKLMMAIKSRSIDVTISPNQVYTDQIKVLEKAFNIEEVLELEPYEKDHAFVTATYLG